ncbi:autotransporter domain-containing protein [Pseudomonas sp. W15Feb34]|uniref:autotransporter outer membrane beta-barrel domain-containing protein n=1 Tax=Pseudomonas sp. W15Feb34 TaxID=550727 RepID=UPI002005BA52|nr:autotransporter domain-containing protein [Pseudomonas sp. W15Feb34]MCK3842090.1 autotransporter domain-containing protein [Pseudomonas sp. W15Feb34]
MKITNRSRGAHRKATVITTSALLLGLCVPEAIAEEKIPKNFAIKTMAFNIWNHAENSRIWKLGSGIENLTYSDSMKKLLLDVSPDILVFPELDNNARTINTKYGDQVYDAFKQNTTNVLNSAPRKQDSFVDFRKNEDTYPKGSPEYTDRDNRKKNGLYYKGIGSVFSSVPFKDLPGDSIRINPGNGFPVGVVTGIHLDHSDSSSARVSAAQDFNKAAAASNVPMIILGDFNAGDVSERGLNRKTQQNLVIKKADSNGLYTALAREYTASKQVYAEVGKTVKNYYEGKENYDGKNIQKMSWAEWGEALESAIKNNKDTGLQDETYPVNSNLPRTLNTFKRQYQLFQKDQNRELFQPSQVGDQRATWTSDGENWTNTSPSWDRATIDHIMVSRPFAKWIEIADDGKPSGNLSKQAKLPNNKDSLSDHEPVAQNLRWVGPQLEVYKDIADKKEKTRLVWGADAYNFAGRNKKFNLVRNNYRNDVYLGQVSDEAGNPTLTLLTLPEKMDLLNCNGSKSKLQRAVDDYCIDNHSFIGETLVKDGGLLVVDEDKALGGSKAKLRLANGGLMVAGLSMPELDREIVLEQQGWIDIAESGLVVSAKKAVTGTGSLTKLGAGTLALSGPNSYTGGTLVEEGILRADTGVGFVNNTAYSINGGALDLNGFDLIASKLEGKGGAVRLGTGSLTLDQSVNTRYDGSIEGSGGLTKSGSGGLILNGQNSYTGATLVRDGHLVIGDSDHPDARLESPVTVSPGATLGGIGTLGALTINAGGRIAPGNSIGTLHTGDVTFDAGSVYSVEVGPNGRSDLIDSAGVATLNGGEVRVSLENRSNLLTEDEAKTLVGQTFNILTAKKGIVGQFASITPNYLFLDSQISVPRTQQLLNGPPVPAAPPAASAIPGATVPPVADAQIVAAPAPAEPGAPETTVPPVAGAQIVAAPAPAEPGAPETTVPPVADAQIVAAPAPAEPGAPETTVPPVAGAQIVAAPAPAEPGAPETTVPPVAGAQIVAAPAPAEPVTPKASVDVAIAPAPVLSPVGVAPVQPVPDMTAMSIAIKRNNTSFASVAQTKNERAVAAVADTLALGNPVYESLLTFNSAEQARQAFKQLDGQVHADAAAAQIADSRYVRDAVNARLQQAQALNPDAKIQVDSSNGGWVQLLGGHTQLDSDHNAASYSTSTTGVLLGLDTDIGDGWRIGGATGYTKTDLKGASRKSANSDNYHLSIYGGKRFDSIALRFGGASTWHHFDTSRNVGYGSQSAHQKAVYNARTDQVFGEVGYTGWSAFEPFANLTYINFQSDAFKERGKATALHASKQSQDAVVSTVGLRGQMQLPVSSTRSVKLRGELGWEHQYAELDRESSLKFVGSEAAFAVNSVPVSRDSAVVKASAEMAMTKDTQVSLNYTGLVSSHGGGSAVNLGFTFQF